MVRIRDINGIDELASMINDDDYDYNCFKFIRHSHKRKVIHRMMLSIISKTTMSITIEVHVLWQIILLCSNRICKRPEDYIDCHFVVKEMQNLQRPKYKRNISFHFVIQHEMKGCG